MTETMRDSRITTSAASRKMMNFSKSLASKSYHSELLIRVSVKLNMFLKANPTVLEICLTRFLVINIRSSKLMAR